MSKGRSNANSNKEFKHFDKILDIGINYTNTLPDLPFDQKFYDIETDWEALTEYQPNTLEQNHKYEDYSDIRDIMFLVETMCYKKQDDGVPQEPMHEDDRKLIESDTDNKLDPLRSKRHNISVPWMRKSQYVSTKNSSQPQIKCGSESLKGFKLVKAPTLEEQLKLIEKTFEDAKKPITKHHSKSHLKPISEKFIYPDMKNWKYSGFLTKFDIDPVAMCGSKSDESPRTQMDKLNLSLLRSVFDSKDCVTYLLPKTETLQQLHRDKVYGTFTQPNKFYEYEAVCNYSYKIKNKSTDDDKKNYIICIRNNVVTYIELETLVNLMKSGKKMDGEALNLDVIVSYHAPSAEDIQIQRNREAMLQPTDCVDEEMEAESIHSEETAIESFDDFE